MELALENLKWQCVAHAVVADEVLGEVARLLHETWPDPEWPQERILKTIQTMNDQQKYRILAWQDQRLVGHATFLPDVIATNRGTLSIMQFAGVCVCAKLRGRQIGRKVVEWAFEKVGQPGFDVALFQTDVPGFYEKLGVRCVSNRFVNSNNSAAPEANPWWNEHVMIYPNSFDWPDGTIDLLGPGY